MVIAFEVQAFQQGRGAIKRNIEVECAIEDVRAVQIALASRIAKRGLIVHHKGAVQLHLGSAFESVHVRVHGLGALETPELQVAANQELRDILDAPAPTPVLGFEVESGVLFVSGDAPDTEDVPAVEEEPISGAESQAG